MTAVSRSCAPGTCLHAKPRIHVWRTWSNRPARPPLTPLHARAHDARRAPAAPTRSTTPMSSRTLCTHSGTFLKKERLQEDGRHRQGLKGRPDLLAYIIHGQFADRVVQAQHLHHPSPAPSSSPPGSLKIPAAHPVQPGGSLRCVAVGVPSAIELILIRKSIRRAAKDRRSKMSAPVENAVFLLLLAACCCVATLACDPNGAKFGYVGSVGPDHWGALSPNFTECAVGTNQSPIDIATAAAVVNPALQPLRRDYTVANGTLVDNIFNIALQFDAGGGNVTVDGKQYRLKQMHWHSPSEHTINGQRFPVELHMVHASDDGNVTVVAMLYRFGRPDPFLAQLQDKLAALYGEGCDAEKGAPVPAGVVSLWPLRLRCHMYYRYVGSFTTPPCTENVVWSILAQVREMSVDQAAALTAPLEQDYRRNNRPTQPMNGRVVQVYRTAVP